MKFNNLRSLEKHLESASPHHFSELYVILVKDGFERKEAVNVLLKALLKEHKSSSKQSLQLNSDLNSITFDGNELKIETLRNELNIFSLFAEKRVILVEHADKLAKPMIAYLEDYFTKPNSSIYLVLSASSISHATNYYKKAEKAGVILEVAEEKPWEKEKSTREWMLNKVAETKRKINPEAVQVLLKQVGTDHALLSQELEKLYCYIGDKQEIEVKDVGAICTSVNMENAWQLGEAIFRFDTSSALRIAKALMEEGAALLSLIRQIRSQFQTDFQVCSLLTSGATVADITQQFPYMRGNILDRHLQSAKSYGMQRFRQGMLHIDKMEVMAKNSNVNPEFLTELLITKLSLK